MENGSLFGKKTGKKLAFFSGLLLFTFFFTPQASPAMTQVRMAIFNFVALNMEASGYGTAATNMLGDFLKASPSNSVMDRKDLEAFLYLNDYQQDDRVENAVNVGTRLGVNAVIVGNVEKKGSWIIVNCQVVLIEQRKVILNTRVGAQGDAGLSVEIRKLAGLINEAFAKYALTASDELLKPPVNMQKRSGNRQIYLSWEDPPNTKADGYDIFRSNAKDGPFAKIGQVHQREYLDKDLEKSATYYYKIKSFTNSGLQSGFTDVIAGETALTPNAPVIIKVESRVKGVQLTWSSSPLAGDDPLRLIGYKLFRANKEQGPFREVADLTGAAFGVPANTPLDKALRVTYVDKNLGDGEEVCYRITVYNESKVESGFSSMVRGSAIPVISGLSAQGGMVREIRLTWNAIDSPYLGGYNIYRHTQEGGNYTRIRKIETGRGPEPKVQYADREGLGDNLRYYYRVTAYDDTEQQTALSAAVSAVTKPRPVKPAGFKGESIKVKSAPLTWQANPEKDVVAYHIYRQQGTDGRFSAVAKVRGGETRHLDKDLEDGVSYGYKIHVEDKDGVRSDFSEEIRISTKPKPKSPEGLTGNYRNGTMGLTWKPGREADIAYYKIYEKTFWQTEAVAGLDKITSPSVTFKTTLDKGKNKTYLVTVVDRDGLESGYSPEIVVTGE
jgi:fibronectin type 3 domain-containing protein/TolB-like protein